MASALFIRLLLLIIGLTESGMIPDDVDDDDADAVSIDVAAADRSCGLTMITTEGLGRGRRIVGELADAAGDQDPDVRLRRRSSLAPCVASNLRGELVVGERERQLDHRRRAAEPPHVAVVEKRPPVIGPHRLVNAFAVEEAVIEDRDHRLALAA